MIQLALILAFALQWGIGQRPFNSANGGSGGIINAASCSQGDVQTAFNAVVASTSTVNIPAGTCTWAADAHLTVPSGNTGLTLQAATTCTTSSPPIACTDHTIIIDNDTADYQYLILMGTNSNASAPFTLKGITIEAGTGNNKQNGTLEFSGFSQNLRLTQIHLNATTSSEPVTFRLVNWLYGVMDHSLLDGNTVAEIYLDEYGNSTANFGDQSWGAATSFGGSGAFFLENNTVNGAPASGGQYVNYWTDCYQGGRMVIRDNILNNVGMDLHPTGGAGRWRGCRSTEIYSNQMNGNSSTPTFSGFFYDSGPALIWGNALGNGYESLAWLVSARNGYDYAQVATPNGWGYCSATAIGGIPGPSNWDQNSAGANGYACLDQVGRGVGQLLNGIAFPGALNSVTGTIAWPSQALEPFYEWLDEWQPTSYAPGRAMITLEDPTHDSTTFVQNRDWYQYTLTWNGSAFTGTPFTGAVGTGSGLAAARPATCTPKVAYWATDTSTLSQCTATNTWGTYYTPYTFPHPLDH